MKIIISILLVLNLVLFLNYYMHMFQLSSYFFKKYYVWIKKNINKIIYRIIPVLCVLVFNLFEGIFFEVVSFIVLFISLICNLPKKKIKIPLKYTNRVVRMFITEGIIILLVLLINHSVVTLIVLNILSFIICLIANIINYPIEKMVRNYYINDAKKILYSMPNLIVIGVTGSYGKTSVKNFLEKTLSYKYEVLTTPKNYNTTMGVVKTIRENLKPTHHIFVCEMGATKLNDIKEICEIVKPSIGVITSIGPQHLQSFKTIDNVIKTKFELYDYVNKNNGVTFLNYDNEYLKKIKKPNIFTYGIDNKKLDYNAYNLVSSSNGLSFYIEDIKFDTSLIGRHNIVNLTAAIAVAKYLNVPYDKMVYRVRQIKSVAHRLELINKGSINIIDDSYNSNPISCKSALDTLNEFDTIKVIVTPGLIELGDKEADYNMEFGEYMCKYCDYICIVNSMVSKYVLQGIEKQKFNKERVLIVNTPNEAVEKIMSLNLNDKVTILLENDLPDNYNL